MVAVQEILRRADDLDVGMRVARDVIRRERGVIDVDWISADG